MSLRDIFFWIRSARADATLARLRQEWSAREALDRLYGQAADPWGSILPCYRYQRLKYETLISLLPARRYVHALDIGCGLGGLTRRLAGLADQVLGVDLSTVAIQQAQALSQNYPNVGFEQADLLALNPQWEQQFDLVVLADTLYYLSPLSDHRLKTIACQVGRLLTPEGVLLLVNHHFYFDLVPGAKMTRPIHDAFRWAPWFSLWEEHWRPFYLASILGKRLC